MPNTKDSEQVNNGWIDVKENLPPLDEDKFSADIYLKVDRRRVKGYYDAFKNVWWELPNDDDYSVAKAVKPTHWKNLKSKRKKSNLNEQGKSI